MIARPARLIGLLLVVAVLGGLVSIASTTGVSGTFGAASPAAAQVASSGAGCIVSPNDMIGWWPGEDDLVGAVGPTLSGAVTYADAVVGRGMAFDGSSSVTSTVLPAVSAAVSVDAWIKPTNTGQVQALVSRWTWVGGDSDDAFNLMLGPGAQLFWETDDTSTRSPIPVTASVPTVYDGQFHHVAATWDQSTETIYFDGVQVASLPSLGGIINPADVTELRIGGSSGPGSPLFYSGVIDEPTIYQRALTAAEVAAIHDAASVGKCPPQAPSGQPAELLGTTGAGGDAMGWSVAVSGSTMVVGSPGGSRCCTGNGVVTVFTRSGTTWSQQAELVAGDAIAGAQFGSSVSLSGDTLIVGAPLDRPVPSAFQGGSAYVFTRTGTTWTQQAKLVSPQPTFQGNFGSSVAVSGDTTLVGSSRNERAAYVFARFGTAWSQQAKLVPSDPDPALQFGVSVALKGDTAAIGAVDGGSTTSDGAAYVFVRSASQWTQQAKLVPSSPQPADRFGLSVALEGDTVVVGAPLADAPLTDSGRAEAFNRTGTAWAPAGVLVPDVPMEGARFGTALALYLGTAVVGAPLETGPAAQTGAAYVLTRSGSSWTQIAKLVADAAVANDQFGFSVAANGVTAAAGAPGRDQQGADSGAAYAFGLF